MRGDAQEPSFPPEPWRLTGVLYLSAWLVRPAEAPAFDLPEGFAPLRVAGRLVVGGVWAIYDGGDLAYRELAIGVLVRRGRRLAVTLPWIWVDSPASLAGGRALWAIPKRLASFPEEADIRRAQEAGAPVAAMRFSRGLPLPLRWSARFTIAQPKARGSAEAPACVTAWLRFGRARWEALGPFGFLARRPLVSLRLGGAEMLCGRPLPKPRRSLR